MVEESGLKGFRIGGAEVSVKHAGFIVNADHATAKDVLQLIDYIEKIILENYNVALVPEVLVLGEE
jgi:UDP-N-acetylmuramate dehydrogenase